MPLDKGLAFFLSHHVTNDSMILNVATFCLSHTALWFPTFLLTFLLVNKIIRYTVFGMLSAINLPLLPHLRKINMMNGFLHWIAHE